MKNKRLAFIAVAASFLLIPGPVLAHHSTAGFDTTKSVIVAGTVSDFQFVNPHVLISLMVKDEAGNVQKWQGYLTSPNRLIRVGWKRDVLKPGDPVTVTGYQAKNGATALIITKVVVNGQVLPTSE